MNKKLSNYELECQATVFEVTGSPTFAAVFREALAYREAESKPAMYLTESKSDNRTWVACGKDYSRATAFYRSPVLSQSVPDDYFASLIIQARTSADKAMRKFPQPNYVLLKVAEEAGEVVQAGVHYAEGRMTWSELEGEIVQLLAMLIRLVTEGDQINGITPPTDLNASPVLGETSALNDVIAERQRQITAEGWTPEHDDQHSSGELSDAAAAYAYCAHGPSRPMPDVWPWDESWWKQTNPRGDLVKAAALILAEIERLDRSAIAKATGERE